MKYTNKYQLGYFEKGDLTTSDIEMQRFETLDAQLYSLFSIMGNGVLNGWNILPSSGLSIAISPGSGHVAFVAVNSTANFVIQNLVPNSTNYIYAQLTEDSYWTQAVHFAAYVSTNTPDQSLLIGTVKTNDTGIDTTADFGGIDTTGRQELGFVGLIKSVVAAHRHIGGTDNPPPIDLSSEVQGVLNQENLPDLDASIIKAGILDIDRIPLLSHITNLKDQGTLTHAQLESLVETLSISGQGSMGAVALTNLMQLVLALKHVYPNIDDFLVNCISIIPGISPDSYIDFTNTTATVDTRTHAEGGEHTITGTPAAGRQLYTKTWDDETDYEGGTKVDVIVDGNSIALDTTDNEVVVDNFSAVNGWTVVTEDTSSIPASVVGDTSQKVSPNQSAKISINGNEIEMVLLAKKEFSPQDWSSYKFLKFYIYTDSVQHGDIFFYFKDGAEGIQNSYVKVLDRNSPTINSDTLQNGWQEVTIDISEFTRSSINFMAFMLSTQDGWDSSKSFYFNVDDITLSSGNLFKDNGYVRFTYGNDFPYNFYALRWDVYLPSGTTIKARARFANTIPDLSSAAWTDYITVSGDSFGLAENEFYKYIELELFLVASIDNLLSPYVNSVYLDYYASDITSNKTIDTQDEWEQGSGFNIDTKTSPGSIKVGNMSDIGTYQFSSDGKVSILNGDLSEKNSIVGTALPKTTNQCITFSQSGFGLITAMDNGNNGNLWIADADNDRVVEIDKAGNLVRGFYGSFLSEPSDVYGVEDSGPGSNVYVATQFVTEFDTTEAASSTTAATGLTYDLSVVHSIYNPDKGLLYVVFNKNLEDIYASTTFTVEKCYLKVGNHVFRMSNSNVTLLGVDEISYDLWIALYKDKEQRSKPEGQNIRQFKFSSHVMCIQMSQSEQIALNKMVRTSNPMVAIAYPMSNGVCSGSFDAEFVFYNFPIGTGASDPYAIVTVDGATTYTIYSNTLTIPGLVNGKHTIKIDLYDGDDNLYTNTGASASVDFIVSSSSISVPVLQIQSPKANQVFSTSDISVEINTLNFPIVPSGQHIKYQVDGGTVKDHNSTNPISISDLEPGSHTFYAYLVDENGNDLGYTYGNAEIAFVVGLNPDALVNLYYSNDFVKDLSGKATNVRGKTPVDVANIIMCNIFCPVDLQVISYETSANSTSIPSILIGKLRSPSWSNYLAGEEYAKEFGNRVVNAVVQDEAQKLPLNDSLASIETANLVFGSNFMDGHSVIQLDLEGDVTLSNNAAVFATSRTEAKNILGSVKKIGQNEILIGDSKNQRAIICYVDTTNKTTKLIWQYDSDRYVVDFISYPQEDAVINVNNGSIDVTEEFVVRGNTVTWKNNTISPIEIYSGNTDYDAFYANPDLTQYGKYFKSDTINPGESYSFRFEMNGEFNWFVYPSILTGKVTVTEQRISSRDMFYILESDGLESPYTSRAIKVDTWGNILWSFGENYLVKPRDIRALSNNKVLIST